MQTFQREIPLADAQGLYAVNAVDFAKAGAHTVRWAFMKDAYNDVVFEDCAWLSGVKWAPDETASEGVVIEVNGATVDFEAAEDGKTRTTVVAEGTTAEDVKVFVGGVDVTAGFKVAVDGTTATVVLKEPFERTDDAAVSSKPLYHENDDGKTVTLNVEVVPGLYYAAEPAATLEALKRPGAAEPAKPGDTVVAPRQTGAQGFYKVWVGDASITAEQGRLGLDSFVRQVDCCHFYSKALFRMVITKLNKCLEW